MKIIPIDVTLIEEDITNKTKKQRIKESRNRVSYPGAVSYWVNTLITKPID